MESGSFDSRAPKRGPSGRWKSGLPGPNLAGGEDQLANELRKELSGGESGSAGEGPKVPRGFGGAPNKELDLSLGPFLKKRAPISVTNNLSQNTQIPS